MQLYGYLRKIAFFSLSRKDSNQESHLSGEQKDINTVSKGSIYQDSETCCRQEAIGNPKGLDGWIYPTRNR